MAGILSSEKGGMEGARREGKGLAGGCSGGAKWWRCAGGGHRAALNVGCSRNGKWRARWHVPGRAEGLVLAAVLAPMLALALALVLALAAPSPN